MAAPRLPTPVVVFWFRRDLRLNDNRGLAAALDRARETGAMVLPLFIFDYEILGRLEDRDDARVSFIYQTLLDLNESLRGQGQGDGHGLMVRHGRPVDVWRDLIPDLQKAGLTVQSVFTNHDYEPYAISRDRLVQRQLADHNIPFLSYKDQVIFERDEVIKDDGKPYTVFTPYSKKWRALLSPECYASESSGSLRNLFLVWPKTLKYQWPTLAELGFEPSSLGTPPRRIGTSILKDYGKVRNFPAVVGTSHLGLHLRFGTVSIRKLVATALELRAETWLTELIWREFFMQILWHFPRVVEHAFRPGYDRIEWRHDEAQFAAWCEGRTGVPIVDAGMRELNATGFMHNRVRMIVASYLVKHLLIDWRWGEAYFARKLLDFDLSANNGNWQWVVGSGCDAAPYFRIFNPVLQAEKFDPKSEYVARWVPEWNSRDYPTPLVEHKMARARALAAFQVVKENSL